MKPLKYQRGVVCGGLCIIVVAGVAALVGAIVGYLLGRRDERNTLNPVEVCAVAVRVESGQRFCTYMTDGANNQPRYQITIAKQILRQFDISDCPERIRVCWKTPKGAPSPSITNVEVL